MPVVMTLICCHPVQLCGAHAGIYKDGNNTKSLPRRKDYESEQDLKDAQERGLGCWGQSAFKDLLSVRGIRLGLDCPWAQNRVHTSKLPWPFPSISNLALLNDFARPTRGHGAPVCLKLLDEDFLFGKRVSLSMFRSINIEVITCCLVNMQMPNGADSSLVL